jgi:D-serine deaminase-like pyridoxal phosphate-dependent protein
MRTMDLQLDAYKVNGAERILTPALLIYPDLVKENIRATLRMVGNDPNRWRPHIKTAKLGATVRMMVEEGVHHFKCATTLELITACECGAEDVLLAFSVTGANAQRTLEIAEQYPETRISVLIESSGQAQPWIGQSVGVFLDLNPGMDRTGMSVANADAVIAVAKLLGSQFRGLHYYDGHVTKYSAEEAETKIHAGYDQLISLVEKLRAKGVRVEEVITSGTPAAPVAMTYPGFVRSSFIHRISPGTVVYNDLNSLGQLPGWGYAPAALVLSTVISHPANDVFTCDGGHKSVSADSGVPTCAVVGMPQITPGKPSEEHLPLHVSSADGHTAIGEQLYLIPKHVCPTVNNFDEAYLVVNGSITGIERVTARGHESRIEELQHF